MKLVLSGGRQRVSSRERPEWRRYEEARLVLLDTESGAAECVLRYQTPPERCPEREPSHVFKSASWDGARLLVPTQTEVLEIDPADWRPLRALSLPCFNDLHHAARLGGRLHVVCTGLDCLVVLDERDAPAACLHALGGDGWARLAGGTDWRKVETTKPHASHPNHVFATEHGVWLTRFEQRDALCLTRPELRIPIGVGRPHDGLRRGGELWFTTVNGHLVAAEAAGARVRAHHDLNRIEARGGPLGWCRGLWLEGEIAFVGFSRIRHTALRRNLSWIRRGFRTAEGFRTPRTRVAAYDLRAGRRVAEWPVEDAGLDAIFSILPAAPPA